MPVSLPQVYKKLGQTHLALMNFSWAMDLDPKGANNQIKEAIDKRYLPEDEGETGVVRQVDGGRQPQICLTLRARCE